MTEGILYICGDHEPYYSDGIKSAKSAKKVMPDIPVAIVTDREDVHDVFDQKIYRSDMSYAFEDKARYMSESPFDKTLYVDTDTYFVEPIDELWGLLDYYDLAACHTNHRRYDGNIPVPVSEYNTGVLLFNSAEPARDVLQTWEERYGTLDKPGEYPNDQASFRSAVFHHEAERGELTFYTLPREFNCMIQHPGVLRGPAKILHAAGTNEKIDFESVAEKLNKHVETPRSDKRVHYPTWWARDGIRVWALCPDGGGTLSRSKYILRRHGPIRLIKDATVELSPFHE
jgi:hypothetical protein